MDNKEQINTLVSIGSNLPPVNPYLDDGSQSDDDDAPVARKKGGKPAKPSHTKGPSVKNVIAPDPKEYIAELERPEEEDLY